MHTEAYDPENDYELLEKWREARGHITPHPSWLDVGFTAGDAQRDAMGFIYLCEGVGVGHLDWFATRPGLTVSQAQAAMDALLGVMEAYGKSLFPGGFVMLGCCQSEAMANRACRSGFIPLGHTYMIAKGIEPWQQHSSSHHSPHPSSGPA